MEIKIDWRRTQHVGEEIANSISHGLGFLGAAAITPILIIAATPLGMAAVTGACIFGLTMMALYLSSTLYHAFPEGRAKQLLQVLDHSAIYLLIAGTYTPFTLTIMQGTVGWTLLAIIWCLAIGGIVLRAIGPAGTNKFSIVLYLGMGWLAVLSMQPLWNYLSTDGLIWLMAGAALYTGGVLFFIYDHRIRYNHLIWHLFVLGGTVCHVVTILYYVY